MMTPLSLFTACRYGGDSELSAIAELINTCRAADNLEHRTTVTRLREDFADPTLDVEHDLQLWRDDRGDLIAFASLWRQTPEPALIGGLHFVVHPQARGSGVESAILAWAEHRLTTVGQGTSWPLVLHSWCRDTVKERRSLLLGWGFQPERFFLKLQRSLETPIPKATVPAGWQMRSVTARDAEPWVDLFNQTFIDHWNHHPTTVAEFRHWTSSSDYDANLDLVVVSPEGHMAAFGYSEINPERNARLGLQEGHVCLLGTRRGYRRLGLARAVLTESLRRLQLLGMTTATIGVDAQNPNGAVKLYQSIGFEPDQRSTVFRKEIRPGTH
jgi:mycothiol synthase